MGRRAVLGLVCAFVLGACGSDGGGRSTRDGGPGADGGLGSDGGGAFGSDGTSSTARDVGPNLDAFFADDPPPMYCGPDGTMQPDPEAPGGTPECPDDKNREGCRCNNVGEVAPCWPGLRANRNRGICHDGTTVCEEYDEFSGRWGTCQGAVLPVDGVSFGPEACGCFSQGRWALENLNPCFVTYPSGEIWAVSTFVGADGNADCPADVSPTPPPSPEPGSVWTANTLTIDCEGQFELCYTIKAGDADDPQPSDCTIARVCTEGWYMEREVTQEFPPLPSWSSTDPDCAAEFVSGGGYGEMSVRGLSVECDAVDDGSGGHVVFNRVQYCPACCNDAEGCPTMAQNELCAVCGMGGSGSFP